jgi:hypothetical protein
VSTTFEKSPPSGDDRDTDWLPNWVNGQDPDQAADPDPDQAGQEAQQPAAQDDADQQQDGPALEAAQDRVAQLRERLGERLPDRQQAGAHLVRAKDRVRDWVMTREISDEEFLQAVVERQRADRERAELELRHQVDRLTHRIVEAETQAGREVSEHHQASGTALARRASAPLRAELAQVEAQLRRAVERGQGEALPPSKREVRRARLARQVQRGCIVVASVVGGILLPIKALLATPVVLLAAAVALWKLGARAPEDDQPQTVVVGGTGSGKTTLTAALPAQREDPAQGGDADQAVPEAGLPVTLESLVPEAVEQAEPSDVEKASQAWLMERLIEAGVVTAESAKRARIVSMLTQGPGWTATVELPGGKKATDAVGRSGEIASALGRKASQLELAVDTSEEGHEGRFTMWVSEKANPYGGDPVQSVLVDAERWDFWRDGVPMGADARGVRKVLNLLWSSLMVGGAQRYGKTFFVRLIAAAAALDPHVRIVLISAKPSADWLPLQKIAYRYVVGKSPEKVREAYDTICEINEELDKVGNLLTKMAEEDLNAVPEGKITRALYRDPRFGLTLLIVDELQNLLLAAADIKSGTRPSDPAYASMIRGKLTTFNRMNAAAGGIAVTVVHRPGPDSPVTADLRDAYLCRVSYRVKGIDSARNVLGPDAVAEGASPHTLLEVHKGVAVVDLGEDGGHYTQKTDLITLAEFDQICTRGRLLRQETGTLTGYAAESAAEEEADAERLSLIKAVVAAVQATSSAEDPAARGGRTEDLAAAMATADPDRYGDLTGQRLGELLRAAGAGATVKLPRQADGSRPNGYRLDTLQGLLRRGSSAA